MPKTKKGIEYKVFGSGSPTLVLVHGWCCNISYWDEQIPHFAKKYEVLALNLPGHGGSDLDREVMTVQAFGEDVASVVNELGLKDAILIGHSLGGYIIMEAAPLIDHKPLGLVGADTLHNFELQWPKEMVEQVVGSMREDFVQGQAAFLSGFFHENDSPEFRAHCLGDMSRFSPKLGLSEIEEWFNNFGEPCKAAAKRVGNIPITVITADIEALQTDMETNRRYNPAFQEKQIPGTGHFLHMSHSKEFNRLLEETIQEFLGVTG